MLLRVIEKSILAGGRIHIKKYYIRTFKTFDEHAFLCDLSSTPWRRIEAFDNIDNILAAWYSLFIAVIDKHAPIRTHRIKHDIQADWLTSEILDKTKQRDKMKKRGRHADYKILRNEVSTQIQNSKQASYKSKIEAGKDDPKSTWKIFKEFSASNKKKDNTDCFKLNIDDNLITNTKEIADTFNDYFVKIASRLKEPIEDCDFTQLKEHIDTKVPSSVPFELPHITESFVYNF